MEFVPFVYEQDRNLHRLKQISKNCGSVAAKKSFEYLRIMFYHNVNKVFSEYVDGVAYYVCCLMKNKIRVIEIAVSEQYQRKGIGTKMIERIKKVAEAKGINKITLRTSSDETAFMFYQKLGFKDVGMNGNDIEMELCL